MPDNTMKPYTREERKTYFEELREAEEAGLKASSEGQLRPATLSEVEEEDESAAEGRRLLNERGVSRTSDDKEEESEGRRASASRREQTARASEAPASPERRGPGRPRSEA